MKKWMFGLAGFCAMSAMAVSFSYQGVLRGATGEEIADRNKVITFRLYDDPTAETALWGRTSAVLLDANGLFNIELGDATGSAVEGLTNTLDRVLAANAGGTLYIGLKVEPSAGEIRPRQKVLSVPFASFASDANLAKRDFTVVGEARIKGALVSEGDAEVKGTATVKKLSVANDATFAGPVNLAGKVNITSGLLELPAAATFTVGGKPAIIPSGVIVMWYGTKDTIPNGWALCDGSNGTPDLRDRFIVGAGRTYDFKKTGGAATVRLTVDQIPSHTHQFYGDDGLPPSVKRAYRWGYYDADSSVRESESGSEPWESGWFYTSSTGGGDAHENLPPYYALCFIMKK